MAPETVQLWPRPDAAGIAHLTAQLAPAELGRVLGELIPNAELILLGSEEELYASIPQLVERVARFLG